MHPSRMTPSGDAARARSHTNTDRTCEKAEAEGAKHPAAAVPDPTPHTNRGVVTLIHRTSPEQVPEGVRVSPDWLTLTIDTLNAARLLPLAPFEHTVPPHIGFHNAESRQVIGGTVTRRLSPSQPSKHHGLDYESWNASGPVSRALLDLSAFVPCRATRVDVAFDIPCDEADTPDALASAIESPTRPEHTTGGFVLGVSGAGGVNTRYVGSVTSPRRIRIYRKDREDPSFEFSHGPTLRIEITLRKDHAHAVYRALLDDKDRGFRMAASHIEVMTGLRLLDDLCPVPQAEPVPERSVVSTLFHLVQQHGETIAAAADAGVDVVGLSRIKARINAQADCRMKRSRSRHVRQLLAAASPKVIYSAVRDLLVERRTPAGTLPNHLPCNSARMKAS